MVSTGPIPAGTLVGGRYRIEEPLAGEGSGAVYRAADTRLDRHVALRALPAAEAGGGQQGRAAARLVHPNVARVLDFGTDAENGLEFVVADLGTGGSLAGLLAQRGTPPLPLALRMVQEAAAGMAAAHRAGLVHGDLHPGIVWLSRDEGRLRVQVLGLGLNPAAAPPPRATARYAAPERLRRSRKLAPAADVFSLGVMAYEVFAGLPADWNQLLLAMARGQAVVAPSLLEQRPEIPAHVAQAVRRALAADPASRWPDAGELAAHLIQDIAAPAQPVEGAAPSPVIVSLPADLAPQPTAATEAQSPAAEPVSAAPEPAEARPEAPKPSRQPLVAGRRGKPLALAGTDLADTIYIPPAISKKPAQQPDAAPAAKAEAPTPVAAASTPPAEPAAMPVVAAETPVPSADETLLAPPAALVPAPQPAMAVTVAAGPPPAEVIELSARRRNGMARLGQPSPNRRGLLAASIVLAVVVIGGVAVKMGMAGGTNASPAPVQGLPSRALASAGGAPAAQPQPPATADSAQPTAETPIADQTLTPEEQRRVAEEQKRLEEQRRLQLRQRDSLRQVQIAAARAAGQPIPPPAPVPQQVALQAPAPAVPAPQSEQRTEAPAAAPPPAPSAPAAEAPAARPSADRIYGADEVDRPPSLANASAFRASVQRTYPSSLRGSRQPGNALVSFVVLPDGRVDRSSVSVSEASQPAFRAAAAEAITAARFNPARAGGRAVRTQVTLRLAWHPDQ